ncbi:MAG: SWIM zinc finger family protein [Firmicutes bacterium]|nr:SWIM zinc finger family protein [Bacillota bacterium]
MGRNKKDEFGSSWWAQKWNNALASYGWSNRLQRGRSYARTGHVLEISLKPGLVEARVQGSRPRPYNVKIQVDKLAPWEWEDVIEKMAEKAIFSAKLLTGEMPENIEEAFVLAGTPLFPTSSKSIKTSCSCPDYANPCKHIAAVYYVIGQEFDRDPFMIFRLRGMEKDELMEALRKARGGDIGIGKNNEDMDDSISIEELQKEMKKFKGLDDAVINMAFSFTSPKVPYSIIKRLGALPFFKEKEDFEKLMALYYDGAAQKVRKLLDER